MEKIYQLTEFELIDIIEETVKRTLECYLQREKQTRLISYNEARKRLGIGYKKLKKLIDEGVITPVGKKIPLSQIEEIDKKLS